METALAATDRLRVLRRNTDTGEGELDEEAIASLEPSDFEGGKGVQFTIQKFGTYVVALELDR